MSKKYRCHLNNWWDRFIDWFIDLLIDWLINWLVNSLTWKGLVYVIVHSWISLRQTFCSQESFIYYFSLNIWGYIYIKLSYTYTCIYIYSQNTDLSDYLHWWVVWVFCFCFFFYNPFKRRYRGISQIDCKISDRRNRHYSFLFKIFFYEQHVIIGFALRTLLWYTSYDVRSNLVINYKYIYQSILVLI